MAWYVPTLTGHTVLPTLDPCHTVYIKQILPYIMCECLFLDTFIGNQSHILIIKCLDGHNQVICYYIMTFPIYVMCTVYW